MRQFRVTFFFLAVALTLSGCGIFGDDDGADVSIAPEVEAPATPNSVQPVPADTSSQADDNNASVPASADAALPTAVTLPTAAPTPEPTVDRSQPSTYIVQSGDVLGLIAERFDADIAELRRVNNLDGNLIQVGQSLTIPAIDGSTTTEADAGTTETDDAAPAAASPTSPPATTVSCNSAATGHCVQPGESLLGIALKYDVTVESLRAANPGVSGDLIKSGEVLNLPGQAADPAPVTGGGGDSTTSPTAVVAALPQNDAECAASNAEYPYFHNFGDGRQGCYANPFGDTTPVPTASSGELADASCEPNFILLDIGEGLLCYPFDGGVTVTATAEVTVAPGSDLNYGRPPCREGYVQLEGTNRCWPLEGTNATTVTPTGTTTTGSGTTVACTEPNFVEDATGKCFVTQAGVDANCEVVANVPKCS